MMVMAFILSFVGFADLINVLYKFMGIVGLFIVVAVLIKYYKRKKMMKSISRNHSHFMIKNVYFNREKFKVKNT